MTLWSGRFSGRLDPQAWALNASLAFDRRLALQDVRGSLAWAQALEKAGVLTVQANGKIRKIALVPAIYDALHLDMAKQSNL